MKKNAISSKNNIALKEENNHKLLETEKRLINEGIIFKTRLQGHNKDSQKKLIKRNDIRKNLSIKIAEKYAKTNNNNSINSMRKKKSSFTKINTISINDFSKSNIKKNSKNRIQILNSNTSPHNIFSDKKKNNSQKHKKANKNTMNVSPYISKTNNNIDNIENGQFSPIGRNQNQYYLNTYKEINNKNSDEYNHHQFFNYQKWNKIIVNNIFDKDICGKSRENCTIENTNINDIKMKNENIKIENKSIKNGINSNNFRNSKKCKKSKDIIPHTYDKIKNKYKDNIIQRNNISKYCKQMTNLALIKEINSNITWHTMNGFKYEQLLRKNKSPKLKSDTNIINKIDNDISNNTINNNPKYNKSSSIKKSNSIERLLIYYIPQSQEFGLRELDFKSQRNSPRITLKHNNSNSNFSSKSKKYNKDNQSVKTCIKDLSQHKYNSISKLNSQMMEIDKLSDNKKIEEPCDKNDENKINKEIPFKEDGEDELETKNELYDNVNEEIYNSNTDLFTEKEKGNIFDNKFELDNTELSFKILNGNGGNNIFYENSNTSASKNNIKNISLPRPSKTNVFTKKIIGGLKINNTDKKIKENKIDEKEVVFKNNKNNDNNNNKFKGEYMELAKICENQEKIISDLVKNVQQLNNEISDKNLCINQLNSQLFSIKNDLLNTLQKTNNNN